MKADAIKIAMKRINEVECFVLTSSQKIYVCNNPEGVKFDEFTETITYTKSDESNISYLIDINDINTVVFNKGLTAHPKFPI